MPAGAGRPSAQPVCTGAPHPPHPHPHPGNKTRNPPPPQCQARKLCKNWWYERSVGGPANLYEAQLARRRAGLM